MHFHLTQPAALWLLSILIFLCAIFQYLQWRLLGSAITARIGAFNASPFLRDIAAEAECLADSVECTPHLLVVIPAHNEELLIGRAVSALQSSTVKHTQFRIVVAADNCTDRTAAIAKAAGCDVAIRTDAGRVGKSWLLHDVFESLLNPESVAPVELPAGLNYYPWDAAVIVDADCIVHPAMLERFAVRIQDGETAIQGCYSILNPEASWRTRLMCCALALVHYIKPLGRERLGLSETLKGSGMCLHRSVLQSVKWDGNALTEDLEYSLQLAEKGFRVAFDPRALLWAEMPATAGAAVRQRRRWEAGRFRLISRAPQLYRMGLYCKDNRLKDRALDLLTPGLAELTALNLLVAGLSAAASLRWPTDGTQAAFGASFSLLLLHGMYVLMGLKTAGIPRTISRALLFAPAYILWKLAVKLTVLVFKPVTAWQRTDRE